MRHAAQTRTATFTSSSSISDREWSLSASRGLMFSSSAATALALRARQSHKWAHALQVRTPAAARRCSRYQCFRDRACRPCLHSASAAPRRLRTSEETCTNAAHAQAPSYTHADTHACEHARTHAHTCACARGDLDLGSSEAAAAHRLGENKGVADRGGERGFEGFEEGARWPRAALMASSCSTISATGGLSGGAWAKKTGERDLSLHLP